MGVSDETLQGMIRGYGGVELSAAELELVRPELDFYLAQAALLDGIDFSGVMSGRLLRMPAGDEAAAGQGRNEESALGELLAQGDAAARPGGDDTQLQGGE